MTIDLDLIEKMKQQQQEQSDTGPFKMVVGDLESDARGTGARANEGKPNWSLNIYWHIFALMDGYLSDRARHLLVHLAAFQTNPTRDNSMHLLEAAHNYAAVEYSGSHTITEETLWRALEETTRVWEYGASKYKSWNWAKGMDWSIPMSCMFRHMLNIERDGESLDSESGRHHGAHILCNAMMLRHFESYYPEGNDLPSPEYFTHPQENTDD